MHTPGLPFLLLGLSLPGNLVSAQVVLTIESIITETPTTFITSTTIVYQTVSGRGVTTTLPAVGSTKSVVTVT